MDPLRRLRWGGALAVTGMLLITGCAPGGATGAASAANAGGSAYAKITYNTAGFLAPSQSGPQPGFGPSHDLDNESAPKPGPYSVAVGNSKVTFMFPNVTGSKPPKDVLDIPGGASGTFTVSHGHYSALYFLASVAGGPQPAQVVLTYSDGTKQTVDAAFDDWCTLEVGHTPVAGTYPAWQGVTRIGESTGGSNNVSGGGYSGSSQGCGLYVSGVNVDKTKVLTSVAVDNTLPSVPSAFSYDIQNVNPKSRINIVAATATTAPLVSAPATASLALTLPAQQPVTLAPTASKLCAAGPAAAQWSAVPSSTVKSVPPGQLRITPSGGDGPWLLGVHDNRYSLYGIGYYAPTNSGMVYLSTGGGVPAGTKNVMLCVEYYDASKTTSSQTGNWLTVQYSGTNPKGPVNGAYDSTTESYALTGTGQWLTASFTLTDINFAKGDPGAAKENGGADMRVDYNAPTYFDRFWLVTTGVQPTQALATTDTATLDAFMSKYQ